MHLSPTKTDKENVDVLQWIFYRKNVHLLTKECMPWTNEKLWKVIFKLYYFSCFLCLELLLIIWFFFKPFLNVHLTHVYPNQITLVFQNPPPQKKLHPKPPPPPIYNISYFSYKAVSKVFFFLVKSFFHHQIKLCLPLSAA